jgi:hypothetical protein
VTIFKEKEELGRGTGLTKLHEGGTTERRCCGYPRREDEDTTDRTFSSPLMERCYCCSDEVVTKEQGSTE